MRILIIEDDKETAQTLKEELGKYFVVELALSGEDGEYKSQINNYDLIILDYILPDINGLEVCIKIRANRIHTPILMLTGQQEMQKKVEALNSGADDYLTKPFSFDELLARIRAILRRGPKTLTSNNISVGDLILDLHRKIVKRKGVSIFLRRKELYILEYLMRNQGKVITREMILDHVWDSMSDSLTNTIDVHIKYLRDSVDKPFDKKLIKTIYGLGYKIEA